MFQRKIFLMKNYETKELKELMDYVGKTLMNKMDCSYETWLNIFQTESKLKRTNQIKSRELYQKLSEEDRKMLLTIIRRVCFNVIYSLLRESQESQAGFPDALYFAARKDNIEYPNIANNSDGLCGEIHLDDGWYEMFSRYFEPDDRLWYE